MCVRTSLKFSWIFISVAWVKLCELDVPQSKCKSNANITRQRRRRHRRRRRHHHRRLRQCVNRIWKRCKEKNLNAKNCVFRRKTRTNQFLSNLTAFEFDFFFLVWTRARAHTQSPLRMGIELVGWLFNVLGHEIYLRFSLWNFGFVLASQFERRSNMTNKNFKFFLCFMNLPFPC